MEDWKKEWTIFLNGHWQLEKPIKPGKYPVVSLLYPGWCGETKILFRDPKSNKIREVPGCGGWGGYWWSEPFPALPLLNSDNNENTI